MQDKTTLNLINNMINKLDQENDIDKKLEDIKIIKNKIKDYNIKINKYKNDIENENNYNLSQKYKNLSFQKLKKMFDDTNIDLDTKIDIYQTYSKKLILLEDSLFKNNNIKN